MHWREHEEAGIVCGKGSRGRVVFLIVGVGRQEGAGAADGSERVHAEGLGGDYDSGRTMTMEAVQTWCVLRKLKVRL